MSELEFQQRVLEELGLISQRVGGLEQSFTSLQSSVSVLESSFITLESSVAAKIDVLTAHMARASDRLENRIEERLVAFENARK